MAYNHRVKYIVTRTRRAVDNIRIPLYLIYCSFFVSSVAGTGPHNCSRCEEHHFCDAGGITPCSDFASSVEGSVLSTDCICNVGYFGVDGGAVDGCSSCTLNFYCTGGNSRKECGENKVSPGGSGLASDCICKPGWTNHVGDPCVQCESGSWCSGGTTQPCPANSTMPEAHDASTRCVCKAGYSGVNSTVCAACEAGTYKTKLGNFACEQCSSGKYSTTSAATSEATCKECDNNSYSIEGSSSLDDCKCAGGYYDSTDAERFFR